MSKRTRVALAVATSGIAAMSHAAIDASIGTSITAVVTDILAVIALGGAAYITIAGGGVVWNVAAKFIKRLGGKAG